MNAVEDQRQQRNDRDVRHNVQEHQDANANKRLPTFITKKYEERSTNHSQMQEASRRRGEGDDACTQKEAGADPKDKQRNGMGGANVLVQPDEALGLVYKTLLRGHGSNDAHDHRDDPAYGDGQHSEALKSFSEFIHEVGIPCKRLFLQSCQRAAAGDSSK